MKCELTKEYVAFMQGYVCAISSIVSGHGVNTSEEEALRSTHIDWSFIDQHDIDVLENAGLELDTYGVNYKEPQK